MTPEELDLIAKIQVDLKCIRDLHPDQWDGDRALNLARNLAVRSLHFRLGIPETQAAIQVDHTVSNALNRVKPGEWDVETTAVWAMICGCLNELNQNGLRAFSAKIADWHKELRQGQRQESPLRQNAAEGVTLVPKVGCIKSSGCDTLLDPLALSDVIIVANTIAAHGEVDEIELLEALSVKQKKQLWGALSRPVRIELAKLGAIRKAGQRGAA